MLKLRYLIFPTMAVLILRALISFSDTNSPLLRKSHFSISLYFSTKTTKPPLDIHTVAKFLTDSHHFSPDSAAQIAAATRLKTEENADSILSFLKRTGFSTPQLEKIIKSSPHLLSAHLDANIKPKFEVFRDLGFTPDEIVEIVSNKSRVLHYSAPRLSSSIAALKSVVGSTAAAVKFLKTAGLFLKHMENTLLPNVELLRSCGVPMEQMIRMMNIPRFFLLKPEIMRKCVEKADQMGSDRKSGRFIHAVRAISSMNDETWGVKTKALRDLGFSEDDVMRAFKNSPKVYTVSEEKMRRVVEVLVASGKYDMSSIVCVPSVFFYSIEKRIRPRLRVLGVLEEKKVIGSWPSLATMVFVTDGMFFEKFVKPNLDHVGELWSGVCGGGQVKAEEM